jgi:hypothetical protein
MTNEAEQCFPSTPGYRLLPATEDDQPCFILERINSSSFTQTKISRPEVRALEI